MSSVVIDGVEWTVEGAQLAIVQRGRVLLQFRPWPPGWELPGGHCEPYEDPAATAARETEEETGYKVRVEGIVGVYSWRGDSGPRATWSSSARSSAARRGAASRPGRSAWPPLTCCLEPCFRGCASECATRSTWRTGLLLYTESSR